MAIPQIYKLLMFGARDWTSQSIIEREFLKAYERIKTQYGPKIEIVVIEGKAAGADTISGYVARLHNCHVAEIGPLWAMRHNSAGPQRNAIMAAFEPGEGIGFHKNIAKSRGTKSMKRILDELGIPNKIIRR